MGKYGFNEPVVVTAFVLLSVGCTHKQQEGSRDASVRPSESVAAGAALNPVDTTDELRAATEEQPGRRADTLPTPDRSQWRPKMPVVRVGSCPGEGCAYGDLVTACEALQLISKDSIGAKPTGTVLRKGDTAKVVTGNLHLLEPGIVVMKRDYVMTDYVDADHKFPRADTLRFFAGDTVYVLDYVELGVWSWWYRAKENHGDEFWTGAFQRSWGPGDDNRPAVAILKPRGEWWYKLQVTGTSKEGWIRGRRGRWVDRRFIPLDPGWKCGSDPEDSDYTDLRQAQ